MRPSPRSALPRLAPTLPSPASGGGLGRGRGRPKRDGAYPLPRLRGRVGVGAMLALFFALLLGMPLLGPLFEWAFPGVTPPVFERTTFLALWLSHAGLVA